MSDITAGRPSGERVILRSLSRRALAVASSALIGLLGGVVLFTGPASAQAPAVEGSCAWDSDAEQWLVTWTITGDAPAGADSYRLAGLDVGPDGGTVEGIGVTPAGDYPHEADQQLVGTQRLPENATGASLTVRAEWDNLAQAEQSGAVEIPADCDQPSLLSQWSLGCDALTITVHNPTDEPATLTFAPNTGNSVPIEVAGGGSATVEFPPSEGLAVDVLLDGRSIVDPADPIVVTAADLADLECDDEDGGGGGGLPATGTSTLLVVVGALILLGLGTGLYLAARRRRIRFTA
jgi:LPXTG-motif cell wall-anchored protein